MKNILNQLFDSISKEDVVLFVGAGLSRCAGLPSGADLSEFIFGKLPDELQSELSDYKWDLPRIASAYVYSVGSKDQLIEEIKCYFNYCEPKDIDKTPLGQLQKLVHFKTIVTTNYDTLIEQSLCNLCTVVASNQHIATRDDKLLLLKIHGDFNNRAEFILTKEDYSNLYDNGAMDSYVWQIAKAELASRTVLFLGYGFNDGNIDHLIRKIKSTIPTRKDVYFMSNVITNEKRYELQSKSIIPIEMNIADFFNVYIAHFNQTIIEDFEADRTSYKTLCKYTMDTFTPKVEGDKFLFPDSISSQSQPSITFSTTNADFHKAISNMNSFDEVVLTELSNFVMKIGDITIPSGEIEKISFLPAVSDQYDASIYFPEIDFLISNIDTKIYRRSFAIKIVYSLQGGCVDILLLFKDGSSRMDFRLTHNGGDVPIKSRIEWLELINALHNNYRFRLSNAKGTLFSYDGDRNIDLGVKEDLLDSLIYLRKLAKIERVFGVEFKGDIEPTEDDKYNIDVITNNIEGNLIAATGDIQLKILLSPATSDDSSIAATYYDTNNLFRSIGSDYEFVYLHGQRIDLGYKLLEVEDFEEISSINLEDGSREITIIAKAGKYKAIFQSKSPETIAAESGAIIK